MDLPQGQMTQKMDIKNNSLRNRHLKKASTYRKAQTDSSFNEGLELFQSTLIGSFRHDHHQMMKILEQKGDSSKAGSEDSIYTNNEKLIKNLHQKVDKYINQTKEQQLLDQDNHHIEDQTNRFVRHYFSQYNDMKKHLMAQSRYLLLNKEYFNLLNDRIKYLHDTKTQDKISFLREFFEKNDREFDLYLPGEREIASTKILPSEIRKRRMKKRINIQSVKNNSHDKKEQGIGQ